MTLRTLILYAQTRKGFVVVHSALMRKYICKLEGNDVDDVKDFVDSEVVIQCIIILLVLI